MLKRTFLISICLILAAFQALCQTTKVRGTVIDATDGQPVPFAAVFFVGTQTGVSTDIDGNYSITTRDMGMTKLRVQMLGYETQDIDIKAGTFNQTDVFLKQQENRLNSVTVKADNRKAKRLLENIDRRRPFNNPEERPGYSCDVYSRMELDLTHPREQLKSKALKSQWGFIFDYIDTSDISGVPYLPVMINETVSKRWHSNDPDVDRETIIANKLSGADPEGNLISQFTGSMHLKNNFYKQFINAFNVEIPSPINSSGLLFYNYYIIDSLQVDGRKTYMVRYHPKPAISTPAFDGEMQVDAEEFALRSIKAKMVRGQNINWLRDMVIEATYQRMEDSTWFYKTDRFYADFSLTSRDSSKLISFIGNRSLDFSNPVFEKREIDATKTVVSVMEDAGNKDEAYWEKARPYDLSEKERNIYGMVERIQGTRLYTTLYDIVYAIINGYYEFKYIGIGPYLKLISFNPLEGFRMRLGAHTSVEFSRKDRLTGYLAYGFKDREIKGGATWEHLFSKTPTRKLTIDGHYDVLQLGRGTSIYNDGNILASVMGAGKTQKLCPMMEFSTLYEHEFTGDFNMRFQAMYRQFYSNAFVPMVTPDGWNIRSIHSPSVQAEARFSRDETAIRGYFIKTYIHTDHPVWTVNLNGGVSMLNPSPVQDGARPALTAPHWFLRPEISLDWKFRIPPVGMSTLHVNAGTVVGRVPYTLLHLHEGNGTYILDKSSFSCMDFFEFASDTWATVMLDHNFYGFFLGKIPFLKKLQMREAFVFKMAWGYLSDRNNGTRPSPDAASAGVPSSLLYFPEGMRPIGKVPYIETGFAITNILRLFRVDFVWRVTHRDDKRNNPRNFVVNFGIELKF